MSVTKTQEKTQYLADLKAIQARIRMAREAGDHTQESMAKALGIKLDAYKKYENRKGSSMPLVTFAKFCELLRLDSNGVLMGKSSLSRTTNRASKAG
jgi:DNA-binding XRE family transcriptional regulator